MNKVEKIFYEGLTEDKKSAKVKVCYKFESNTKFVTYYEINLENKKLTRIKTIPENYRTLSDTIYKNNLEIEYEIIKTLNKLYFKA